MKTAISKQILLFLILSVYPGFSFARIIRVPADYPTIQECIRVSSNGDTVLVSPGEYFENLNFRGKKIVLTSLWYLNRDTSYIRSTIINGSKPAFPDTVTCVIFNHGEDATTILQGFTITGGKGTKWRDIHNGMYYREGGGIISELSSPVIRYNIIEHNEAIDTRGGVQGAGGGGLRLGDGNPSVLNNIIAYNKGKYGAGIVLNYTGITIRNNLIAYNTGSNTYYGGAGIWCHNVHGSDQRIVENNTIIGNEASVGTGGILAYSCKMILRNNIIWGNKPSANQTYNAESGTMQATFCDVQNGLAGNGNINQNPLFGGESFMLSELSPCIDKGDSAGIYNDPEEPLHPGMAKYPAKGTIRNDMGAYGGPFASLNGYLDTGVYSGIPSTWIMDMPQLQQNYPNPASYYTTISYNLPLAETIFLTISDLSGRMVTNYRIGYSLPGFHQFQIDVSGLREGKYVYCLEAKRLRVSRQMIVVR
jgi:hypothetical protein